MPRERITESILLPELHFVGASGGHGEPLVLEVEKRSELEVCPRCATPSTTTYDHRTIRVKDEPLRGQQVALHIRKRRLFCKPCGKPFTEPVPGIRMRSRTTERYRKRILWACEHFSNLKDVRETFRCSSGFVYRTLYGELSRKARERFHPWPEVLGLDEHFFRRRFGYAEFASIFVDYKKRSVMELVHGRSVGELDAALRHIPGRENVRFVVTDMCQPFRAFVQQFFPHARIVADKFHVLRLLHPALNRYRKAITGDRRSLPIRRLLLRSGHTLDWLTRKTLHTWLDEHPDLGELYRCKEALHRFYRTKGRDRAAQALTWLTDQMAKSSLVEIRRLRRTLLSWRKEILAYFGTGLTNGRTEGFNNVATLVKKRAFGYRNFENYRLRLLNACA